MQKSPATTVTTASTSTMAAPDKDMREVYMLGAMICFLAIVVAAFWYYSQADEAAHSNRSSDTIDHAQVSQVFTPSAGHMPVLTPVPANAVTGGQPAASSTGILHDDIHFELGRKGLSDEGKAVVQRHAQFLKSEPDWGILLTGYTDRQGSINFNKMLGQKRAETVKHQLLALGVPEGSIRTASLGEEGALCLDDSDLCRRMNRRVHLEMRKVGSEHLVIPAVMIQPALGLLEQAHDQSAEADVTVSTTEHLPPSDADSSETVLERIDK